MNGRQRSIIMVSVGHNEVVRRSHRERVRLLPLPANTITDIPLREWDCSDCFGFPEKDYNSMFECHAK